MILDRSCIRLVFGILLIWTSALQATSAFILVMPTGKLLGKSLDRMNVASFQRSDDIVRSSSNGLSEWSISQFPHLSANTESSPMLTSHTLAAVTLDPTTLLSDVFGSVLGTPLILAIPIVAALAVATLIAFGIVSYANPAEEEE